MSYLHIKSPGRAVEGGPGGPWPPQYFCPAPPKSLGQVVNDPILSHPCPKELDCGLNSPENKDFGLPRPGKFFWPPQSQNPTSLPGNTQPKNRSREQMNFPLSPSSN